jgi:hypothetical protein
VGYVAERKTFRLVFEDHPGLEVRARSVPLGAFLDVLGLAALQVDVTDPAAVRAAITPHDIAGVTRLFDAFGGALIEWNLEEEDGAGGVRPVPATPDGIRSQDVDFMLEVANAWLDGIAGVPAPLSNSSSGGEKSQVPWTLPMAPQSPSLAS